MPRRGVEAHADCVEQHFAQLRAGDRRGQRVLVRIGADRVGGQEAAAYVGKSLGGGATDGDRWVRAAHARSPFGKSSFAAAVPEELAVAAPIFLSRATATLKDPPTLNPLRAASSSRESAFG